MLEPLTDLPIEEPLDGGLPVRPARDSSAPAPSGEGPVPTDARPALVASAPSAAGEELIDPEVLLGMTPPTLVEGAASVSTPAAHDAASDQKGIAPAPAASSAPGTTDLIDPDELLSAQLLTGDPAATPARDNES